MMLGTNPHSKAVVARLPHDSVGIELGVWRGDTTQVFLESGRVRLLHLVDAWSVRAYRDSAEHAEFGSNGWDGYLNKYKALAGGRSVARFQRYYDAVFSAVEARFTDAPVVIHRMMTAEFLAAFQGEVDWVYVDASHDYGDVHADLEGSMRIVRSGGLILGDDYQNPSKPGVTKAVDEFVQTHGLRVHLVVADQFEICIRPA